MRRSFRLTFILLILLFTQVIFSYQLEYSLKGDCSYFKDSSFSPDLFYNLTQLIFQKANSYDIKRYSFVDSTHLVCVIGNKENELVYVRETLYSGEILKIYNKSLDRFYTFEFDEKIGFDSKQNNIIKFNPTNNKNQNNEIVLKLYSKFHLLLTARQDIRTSTITIADIPYFFAFTSNNDHFNETCSFYIDRNHNGKFDLFNELDENGNNKIEKYNINDTFTLNDKLYQISSISPDGFYVEIKESKLETKISSNCYMPDFEFISNKKTKTYSNKCNKVTFIFWWNPYFPHSISRVPEVNAIWDKFKDYNDFNFISLSYLNEDEFNYYSNSMISPNSVTIKDSFPTEKQIDYSLIHFFGETVPLVIIVDKNGVIKLVSYLGDYGEIAEDNLKTYENFVSVLLEE